MAGKDLTVAGYLAALSPERRQQLNAVRRLIKQHLPPGYRETIQYGSIGYVVPLAKYPAGYLNKGKEPIPYLCLASQKSYMAVYLMGLYGDPKLTKWFSAAWRKTGKPLDMGKSCLRFKSVDDLALEVLGQAVAKVALDDYVAVCAAAWSKRGKPRTSR